MVIQSDTGGTGHRCLEGGGGNPTKVYCENSYDCRLLGGPKCHLENPELGG